VKQVPVDRPVIFLANHQNALMDPLVIAALTSFRTYFLTRSDIFINPMVNQVFRFLRMLPVYRMRDGRDTLNRNQAIFENCTQLLRQGEYILLFPEANHNIMRRVRPLSKGFTRILFATLDKYEQLDVLLVPVGINYENASGFPDRVAFYFGQPISSREFYNKADPQGSVIKIKEEVSLALKQNTTHIAEGMDYDEVHHYLDCHCVDFLDPHVTNRAIEQYNEDSGVPLKKHPGFFSLILRAFFLLINAPSILIWRAFLKPRIQEAEFVSTFRFAYALVVQPIFYVLLWWVVYRLGNASWATIAVICHFLFNMLYVKWGRPVPKHS
jgi:1-acyl-sn-glycerol-3-phosphate acyltransferase